MKNILLVIILLLKFGQIQAQNCLDVEYRLGGYFYAGTSITDSAAIGGFAQSPNKPRQINEHIDKLTEPSKLQLIAKIDSIDDYQFGDGIQGFKVFLINKTDSVIRLAAQDSRLNIVRQAFHNGEWLDIEELAGSFCGNSYHSVFLNKNEYWDFTAPCLAGNMTAKFRFALTIKDNNKIYSNEFHGALNESQLRKY